MLLGEDVLNVVHRGSKFRFTAFAIEYEMCRSEGVFLPSSNCKDLLTVLYITKLDVNIVLPSAKSMFCI